MNPQPEPLEAAYDAHYIAKQRLAAIEQEYRSALSEETIAAHRVMDLLLRRKNEANDE